MATESPGNQPAQCSVPNITFSTEPSNSSSLSGGPTTPNTPVLLLARHRDPQSSSTNPAQSQRNTGDMASVSLLQRPLSAPTSLETSSSPGSSVAPAATGNQFEPTGLDVDSSIVEALKSSKDRLYVLKLGETMESLISQGVLYAKVDLQPASSYQRLLVHRCAAFYHLTQESSQNSVAVIVTADSRIPSKRIAELVPPEESVLPAFQIMRRIDRSKAASRATSVDGNLTDDGDESTRSQGSGSKKKQHMTMEERAAAYKEARSRIFMDFDEKDASASSNGAISSAASTVSFTGGSTGMSSVDGDGASTAPTESEYSGPAGRGKEPWYGGPFNGSDSRVNQMSGGPPNTTLRSTAPPFISPNVAPPPPKGTLHYIQPTAESNGSQEMAGHMQQQPSGPPPAGSYAAYATPAIYPYYMPYIYPFPYPQQVSFQTPVHGGPPSQEMHGQEGQNNQQQQQQPSGPTPPGFGPPMAHPMPAQPYPGYVWMAAPAPGYIPVPSHAAPMPSHPPTQPQSSSNISRPASQASHVSFDPRSQSSGQGGLPQHPTPQQQHQQIHAYGAYHAAPNAFPGSHPQSHHNPMSPNRAPMQMQAGPPPPMHVNMPNHHPNRPHSLSSGMPYGPMGPSGPPPPASNASGPWGNQGHPSSPPNMTGTPPRSLGRGNMLPPPLPGRPSGPDGNWGVGGAGLPGGLAGPPKRGGPRTPWGSYSFGPGVGVGGMQTLNTGVSAAVLRAPEGLNIRVLPAITLDGHSTGSSNGSSSSTRKRGVGNGAGNLKSLGDETSSVTSSSSSSSKRTYTSTASSQPPQHHPLPERPDWVMGARPQPGGAIYNRSKGTPSSNASNNSSSRSLLPPLSASGTPSPVSNPGQLSSTSSSVSGGTDSLSREFPPLVNDAKVPTPSRTPGGAWNNAGSTKAAVGGTDGVPPSTRIVAEGGGGSGSRFDEPDKKFERPPTNSGAALFNPRVAGPSRSKSRDSTLATAGTVDDLNRAVAGVTLGDEEQKEPSETAEVDNGRVVVC